MNEHSRKSVAEVFEDFVISQTAQDLSDITIANYRHHFHSISRHLDIWQPMEALTKSKLEAMVVSMRKSGLAHNSISSYCRVLRTFLGWCQREGMTVPSLPHIKDKETVKETYTDAELAIILKRPDKNCSFCEYRNWVIVNFLMNCGCRSASLRNIQNRDVDLDTRQVILRHNKNGKIQAVPLCSVMVSIVSHPLSTAAFIAFCSATLVRFFLICQVLFMKICEKKAPCITFSVMQRTFLLTK